MSGQAGLDDFVVEAPATKPVAPPRLCGWCRGPLGADRLILCPECSRLSQEVSEAMQDEIVGLRAKRLAFEARRTGVV